MTEVLSASTAALAAESTMSRSRRVTRAAAAVASGGLIVGMGAAGTTAAVAATGADCTVGNTLSAPADDAADIQVLLDADTAIVCLSGTFTLASPLTFDHDVTLFGLTSAQLDGNSLTQILTGAPGADLTVQNLSFVDGRGFAGGAIYVDGDLAVIDSTFTGNTAIEDGGAIFIASDAYIEVTGSTFTGNSTGPLLDGFDGYSGGAIFTEGTGSFTVTDSTFADNVATLMGGAIAGYAVLVDATTFTENAAAGGGALYAPLMASFESTFTDNDAVVGGAIFAPQYGATFSSTFVDNTASEAGGAFASYGEIESLNSTFVGNSASEVGGAVVAGYGELMFTTFLDNRADDLGLYSSGPSDSVFVIDDGIIEIRGNIFAGTRPNAHLGIGAGDFSDLGGNVFSTSAITEAALTSPHPTTLFSRSVTEIFGPSPSEADNGGSTETVALIAGSPAIDAVPPLPEPTTPVSAVQPLLPAEFEAAAEFVAAVGELDEDQRGTVRAGFSDAGAYEFGDAELAATGPADAAMGGWLAATFVGLGSLMLVLARRRRVR